MAGDLGFLSVAVVGMNDAFFFELIDFSDCFVEYFDELGIFFCAFEYFFDEGFGGFVLIPVSLSLFFISAHSF